MDIEIVRKIKEQIAEWKYPIDLEAITDSLFQSYRELAN
jgi:anti-sigma28 factor (negative regulator of flagellin synthesis)